MSFPGGPGGQALRKGRFSEFGRAYLLTTVTYRWIPWFASPRAARTMCRALQELSEETDSVFLCWVVMPDHVHMLLQLGLEELPRLMRGLKGRSAVAVNRSVGRGRRFWAPGYHDRAIHKSENLRKVARYVIGNPLRAGLVEDIGQYPYWNAAWLAGSDLLL